jgi:hypothetical protein
VLRRSSWIAALAAAAAIVPAGNAAAGIWTPVDSQTTADITAVEYQAADRLWWATTNGRIFRQGVAGPELTNPAVSFNDIAFRAGGDIGLAVGTAGTVYRWGGASWTLVSLANASFDHTCGGVGPFPTFTPVGNLNAVAWADANTAYIVSSERGIVLKSTNGGLTFTDVSRKVDGTCFMDGTGDDVATLPGTQTVYVLDRSFGKRYVSSNGITSTMVSKGSTAVNCFAEQARFALDTDNPNRSFAVGGCSGSLSFGFSQDTAETYDISLKYHAGDGSSLAGLFGVAIAGGSAVAVGNAGAILVNPSGPDAYFQRADGVDATTDWRAVSKFDATHAAVGGRGGRLALSSSANAIPDLVAPSGTITGPSVTTAGATSTFTAAVGDNPGGSGIDPAGFSWTATGIATATGNPVQITFPAAGTYTLRVTFRDLAGNAAEATKVVSVRRAASSATGSVPGASITLKGPSRCVPAGGSFTATLTWKRKKRKGNLFVKVRRVDFFIDSRRVKIDRKAPFRQRLTVRNLKAGSTHVLRARAYIKVKRGKSPTKTLRMTFRVCA